MRRRGGGALTPSGGAAAPTIPGGLAQVTVGESTLAIDFTALYISGSHADIRVVAKDGELPAHRAILAARSPRLIEEGLLVADEEGRQGRVLKFPTLPLSVMEAFVQALYTNTLAIVRARCAQLGRGAGH